MFDEVSPDEKIASLLSDFSDSRDLSDRGFIKKAGVDVGRAGLDFNDSQFSWGDGKGMLHTETIKDPDTGREFTVSMDAKEDAQFYKDIGTGAKALGGAALLGGVYSLLKGSKGGIARAISPIAGISSIAMGLYGLKNIIVRDKSTGYTISNMGTPVPGGVKGIEKKSAFIPHVGERLHRMFTSPISRIGAATALPIAAVPALQAHYEGKLRKGTAGSYRTPVEEKMDTAGRYAYTHPYLTGGGAVVGANLGLNVLESLRKGVFKR